MTVVVGLWICKREVVGGVGPKIRNGAAIARFRAAFGQQEVEGGSV
jgi:hypothetical protein